MKSIRQSSLAALGVALIVCRLSSPSAAGPLNINSFAANNALDVTSGTLVFNTGGGTPSSPSGAVSLTLNGNTLTPSTYLFSQGSYTENGVANWGSEIAVYSFNDVSIGPNVTLQVTGSRPIAILSHGDFSLLAAINASGANGSPGSSGTGGTGGAGGVGSASGSSGLVASTGHPAAGSGPGAGPQLSPSAFADGPSAAFGGAAGNDFFKNSPPGTVYGDLTDHLEGGSSGGGAYRVSGTAGGGGGGGGAVELGALNTLTVGAALSANGGTGSNGISGSGSVSGGNGSGGGILLFAGAVTVSGSVSANGGGTGNTLAGGGGGGRVAVYGMNYTLGSSNNLFANAASDPGGAGDTGTAGVISVDPNLVTVPSGQSLNLTGQWTTVRNASGISTSRLDMLVNNDVSVTGGAATFAGNNVLANTANLSVSSGTINMAGFSQAVNTLSISGGNLNGPGILVVNGQISASGGSSTAIVAGIAGLTKTGSGDFILPGTWLYSGATEVAQGTLNVPAGNSTSSSFHVDGGATLAAAGTIGVPFTADANSTTTANGALTLGNNSNAALTLNGTLNVGANPVTLVSGTTINFTGATTLAGGSLTSATPLHLLSTGTIGGSGAVAASFASDAGSQVTATGPLTLGNLSSAGSVNFGGSLAIGSQQVVLLSADKASLGNTTMGAGGNLTTVNGAALPIGSGLTATGAATVAGDFTNQGTVHGPTSAGAVLEFRNNVNGAGSFTGQVQIDGVYSPGNSPAAISLESLDLPSTSTLKMEIAGLTAGSQYDQLNLTSELQLAGKLNVVLINPTFTPAVGNQFDLLNAPSIGGQFSSISLPDLPRGLSWDSSQLYSAGIISVVPEPSAGMMAGIAGVLGALAGLARIRNRKSRKCTFCVNAALVCAHGER